MMRFDSILLTVGLLAVPLVAVGQIPAFPGAEGAGAIATGGRHRTIGGVDYAKVYKVTTLAPDPTGVIPGSLRYGMKDENWRARTIPHIPIQEDPGYWDVIPRVIVFDVGGTIDLSVLNPSTNDIDIAPRNFTLAGQTAPGGITLHGAEFNPGHKDQWDGEFVPKVNNLIIRNIAVRTNNPNEKDGIWFSASNSIADHVSVSWYTDEGYSITDGARNITLQYAIAGPGWNNPDGDGSQIEGHNSHADISVHHNLYIHNDARNPRLGEKIGDGVELDFRNNVIYNWNDNAAGYGGNNSTRPGGAEYSFSNFVNNYYIGGTNNDNNDTIFQSPGTYHQIYQSGNLLDRNFNASADGTDLGWTVFTGNETQLGSPLSVPHGVTQTPDETLSWVQQYAGSRWWDRDFLDDRVIDQLLTYGNSALTTAQRGQVLATVPAEDITAVKNAPLQSHAGFWDTEEMGFLPDPDDTGPLAAPAAAPGDGMPTWWERLHGLDPSVDDHADDADGDGYMNIEEYINEIAEWPAPDNIRWISGNGRYAEILKWGITRPNPGGEADTTTNWQPTRFDTAVIDDGTIEVDATGQHAKFVRLATGAGDNATLDITGGWLKVEDELEVGVHASATAAVSLSGGTLSVHELTLGSGGSFSFTGGTLYADEVNFDLDNDGGTIGPGDGGIPTFNPSGPAIDSGVGQLHVAGDLTITSGTLEIELGSASTYDKVLVDDVATIDGDLEVEPLFLPDPSDTFEILTADSRSGTFDNAATEVQVGFTTFDVNYTATSVLLSNFSYDPEADLWGDYNGDDIVNALDYIVWRDNVGLDTVLPNDLTPGTVNEFDFGIWQISYGDTPGGSGQGLTGVPEPSSISLAALGLSMGLGRFGRRRHVRRIGG